MARVPTKHDRDHPLDFEGFLNNLQDWELSLKDKDKKLKSQPDMEKMESLKLKNASSSSSTVGVSRSLETKKSGSGNSQKVGGLGVDRRNMGNSTSLNHPSIAREENYMQQYDAASRLSSGFIADDSSVDANSEKELGNEFFKQRKYKEAVECYSRSLALSPTAVAYANRAMAYLKLKRHEAEDDCTEALNLDDRSIKAYSRRSTARKELGKLKDSKEDADFALRLEPHNQEIKKQYAEAKSLYDKELLKKASASVKEPAQLEHKELKLDNVRKSAPKISETTRVTATKTESPEELLKKETLSLKGPTQGEHKELKLDNGTKSTPKISETMRVTASKTESPKINENGGKKFAKESVQQLAARAASLAAAEAAKNIIPPTSAYQFEASWRGFFGDPTLQACLLKATNPVALPQIFKNALSASILIDIIRCVATFFNDETELAVKYLENLPKVSRFNTIIMCLSPADKSDLQRIWDDVFCNKEVAPEILQQLRAKYCC
ncbi:hypothetical protein E3N88_28151 [Mikania micrantha]|uniref:RNA-polymerase II-associated protein 3-like C-terminal domain-containing protein n=1 Tax=Mikania micrantha TaxID=192012 RepID=A0A5N6MZU5_9ASTR|nr:hypothetical protein E3N88_28151 [Mikania micrantha]